MADPYEVLGIATGSTAEEIRRRYLELVRQYPPERDPERFAAIRAAYEQLRDPVKRLESQLFGGPGTENMDSLVADVHRRLRSSRIPTTTLLWLAERR